MTDRERYDRDDPLVGAMFSASRAELPSPRVVEKTIAAVSGAAGLLSAAAAAQAATSALAAEENRFDDRLGAARQVDRRRPGGRPPDSRRCRCRRALGRTAGDTTRRADRACRDAERRPPGAFRPGAAREHRTRRSHGAAGARAPERAACHGVERARGRAEARAAFEDAPGPLPTSASRGDALSPELVCIDGARAALGAGNFGEALARSERCEREHPRGRLALEALLIRMHALEGMGQSAAARGAAQRLIALAPKSPHAARARALLDARRENSVIDSPPSGDNGSRRP